MAAYYFQVASLPMLLFDRKAPLSLDAFVSSLENGVSSSDRKAILASSIDGTIPQGRLTALGKAYFEMEKALRNELVRLRSAAKGGEGKGDLVDYQENPYVVEAAAAAFKAASPLESECLLLQWRWKVIDELQSSHLFDADFLAAYYLKLQLLIRMDQFDIEKGKENFNAIYDKVLKTNPVGEKE